MLLARVRRHSPEAQSLLEVLCVAGCRLPWNVALQAAGQADALEAGLALCDAKLARTQRDGEQERIALYHARIREAFGELDVLRVRAIHKRIADAFQRLHPAECEEQLRHRLLAGEHAEAAELALVAAERAARHFAWNHAANLLRVALDHDPSRTRRATILERLGFALANARKHSAAADVYLMLLREAVVDPEVRLSQLAARQLLHAGRLDEGMHLIKQYCRRVGLYFPALDQNPTAMYLRARAEVRLTPALRAGTYPALPLQQRTYLDAAEGMVPELLSLDPMRARILHGQYYRAACRSGDRRRILNALVWEIVHIGYLSGKRGEPRVRRLLHTIATIAAELGTPVARGLQWFAEGFFAFSCQGTPGLALTAYRRAAEILDKEESDKYVSPEMLPISRSIAAELSGDFDELHSLSSNHSRDQVECLDLAMPLLLQGVPLTLLVKDEPGNATRFIEQHPPAAEMQVAEYFRVVRASDVALYTGQHEQAAQLIDDIRPLLAQSILYRSPLFAHSFAFYCARGALCRYFTTRDPKHARSIQRQLAFTGGATAPRYNRGFLRLIAASLAVCDGRTAEARGLLQAAAFDFTSAHAHHGAICAQYRLAQLDRDTDAWRNARDALHERGVVNSERWVAIWAPMPQQGVFA
jgi:hypothetical protein